MNWSSYKKNWQAIAPKYNIIDPDNFNTFITENAADDELWNMMDFAGIVPEGEAQFKEDGTPAMSKDDIVKALNANFMANPRFWQQNQDDYDAAEKLLEAYDKRDSFNAFADQLGGPEDKLNDMLAALQLDRNDPELKSKLMDKYDEDPDAFEYQEFKPETPEEAKTLSVAKGNDGKFRPENDIEQQMLAVAVANAATGNQPAASASRDFTPETPEEKAMLEAALANAEEEQDEQPPVDKAENVVSDEKEKNKKEGSGSKTCVSDATMKNIYGALTARRFM